MIVYRVAYGSDTGVPFDADRSGEVYFATRREALALVESRRQNGVPAQAFRCVVTMPAKELALRLMNGSRGWMDSEKEIASSLDLQPLQ
jgi:hypothetical protein